NIPISDADMDEKLPPYYHPGEDSDIARYLHQRREALGGSVPERRLTAAPLALPDRSVYQVVERGSGKQEVATTMAFVRLLKDLLKDAEIGRRIVPIIPDEARTFGMDAMFPVQKIYSPQGQTYLSVDRELMLSYQEATDGQLLHQGINEAGSAASFMAAGTSYATHGEPMIPVYIFYSMFGFQRTADEFWAAADQMTRGFVIGATAGRTTLNGEGLQHEDGHSHLIAATNPAVVAYDPAFAFEVGHIVRDALRRMYGPDPENIFYYLTVYNEPIAQPPQPDDLDVEGLLRGLYRYAPADGDGPRVRLLASGSAMPAALRARELLAADWGVAAEVWSVTSWVELHRDGLATDAWNFDHPEDEPRAPYLAQRLADADAPPVVAVSDYQRAVQELVRPWVPGDFASLGTDGFGLSDTRGALRRHFHIDAESIAFQALRGLASRGDVDDKVPGQAFASYRLDDVAAADPGVGMGDA
ncbi:MAG: pyruvate dehydrogenase (acetyl-transferring), homodimeric type, partial [Actinomycetota bacterium]|nr:pyruvate dehydrogenase (acetyl-transferring), homodimeric type [Actinomycetota bacterium]